MKNTFLSAIMFALLILIPINAQAGDIAFSGTLETEITSETEKTATSTTTTNITTPTVEFAIEGTVNDRVTGTMVFKWEEGATTYLDVDEAFFTINLSDAMSITTGKLAIPFGNYGTFMVSDPMTLEIGEINQSVFSVSGGNDMFSVTAGTFNGDIGTMSDKEDKIGIAYIAAEFAPEEGKIKGGVSWVSSISESGLSEEITKVNATTTESATDSLVAGLAAYVNAEVAGIGIQAEYVSASSNYKASELDFAGAEKAKPLAWNLEATMSPTDTLAVAARVAGTKDLYDFQPEKQYGVALIYEMMEATTVAVEYMSGEYSSDATKDTISNLTVQFAVEF
jgi:hypothetical protein